MQFRLQVLNCLDLDSTKLVLRLNKSQQSRGESLFKKVSVLC
jgi:hypothetical protein